MNLNTVTEIDECAEISPKVTNINTKKAHFRKLNASDKTQKPEYYYRTATLENKTRIGGFCSDNLKFIIGE